MVNYLEAALNQILIYRECFEINLQSEVKRGAEGTVREGHWGDSGLAGLDSTTAQPIFGILFPPDCDRQAGAMTALRASCSIRHAYRPPPTR